MSKIEHLNEEPWQLRIFHSRPADLRELETEFSKIKVNGGRMNQMQMKVVDQTECLLVSLTHRRHNRSARAVA